MDTDEERTEGVLVRVEKTPSVNTLDNFRIHIFYIYIVNVIKLVNSKFKPIF